MSVNIIGIFDPNSPLIMGAAISTTSTITILAAAATNGQANDAPLLTLRDYYDADAGAGTTSTAWDLTLLHDMTAGGATPASSGIFKINSVAVLTLTNTNGTPSATFPGNASMLSATDVSLTIKSTAGNVAKTIVDRPLVTNYAVFSYATNGTEKWWHGLITDPTLNIWVLRDETNGLSVIEARQGGALTLKPTTANGVRFADSTEGGTGSMNIKTVRQVVTLSGAQTSTTINIPSGAMLLGASFNVDTAVVTSSATNTWDADYTGGSTTNLVAASTAGAQNTKANKLIVPEIASAQTNIEFDAPGAETFSSGAIEVVAYYIDQTSLANA